MTMFDIIIPCKALHWCQQSSTSTFKVTPSFLPACSQLELGELLHDEMFGLFEAMSAIEMMDPKMDAGMICNRSSNTPLSFEEAVATGHLVLSKEELKWADMVGFF